MRRVILNPVREAGFRQELLRLRGVELVAGIRQRAQEALLDRPLMQNAVERHDRPVDAVVVDQRADREANLRVRQRRILHADGDVVVAAAAARLNFDAIGILERIDVGRGEVYADVDVAALQHQPLRLRLGHVPHDDALQGRCSASELAARRGSEPCWSARAQRERAGAGRVRVEPGGAEIVALLVLLHQLAVDDRSAADVPSV